MADTDAFLYCEKEMRLCEPKMYEVLIYPRIVFVSRADFLRSKLYFAASFTDPRDSFYQLERNCFAN